MKYLLICLFTLLPSIFSCSSGNEQSNPHQQSVYQVSKFDSAPEINADWDKVEWADIKALVIDNYMGERPGHFPGVQAKIAYDQLAIYVIFRVEDQYVRAIHNNHQDPVFKDSCVEFFFSPEGTSDAGYFNLEMNCGGKMLFHHQAKPRTDNVNISTDDIEQVTVAHSLPEIVDPEIETETTWTVEYRIPFSILQKYHKLSTPKTGTIWRANLYKCADGTSHPHWLTWAPIDYPSPNFHMPQYFGSLEFVD